MAKTKVPCPACSTVAAELTKREFEKRWERAIKCPQCDHQFTLKDAALAALDKLQAATTGE